MAARAWVLSWQASCAARRPVGFAWASVAHLPGLGTAAGLNVPLQADSRVEVQMKGTADLAALQQSAQKAVHPAALPKVGGRHGLQAGQDGRGTLLQMVDGHQHVAIAGQGATVAVVHLQRTSIGSMHFCLSPLPES